MSDLGPELVKGHGTGNDFVLLPDLDGSLDLSPDLVAAVYDRRTGLGADGVLRVVPSALAPEATAMAGDAHWFMDYRNADGSLAEMCGNGLRVFARFLVRRGLVEPGRFAVATRAGVHAVEAYDTGDVVVDMGPARLVPSADLRVTVDGGASWPAQGVDVGNPHAVVWLDELAAAGPLREPPAVAPASAFPHGVNVEFAVRVGERHLAMRVHERGVGETQSCGTGAAAVFAAALGETVGGSPAWVVDVPGGRLRLRRRDDGGVELAGPAVLVAEGVLEADWVDGVAGVAGPGAGTAGA